MSESLRKIIRFLAVTKKKIHNSLSSDSFYKQFENYAARVNTCKQTNLGYPFITKHDVLFITHNLCSQHKSKNLASNLKITSCNFKN